MGKPALTIEIFIERTNQIHQNKFDYSRSVYVDNKTKIEIICPLHGSFWQTPRNHLIGRGCRKCAIEKSKFTIEKFIEKANKVHSFLYDYSESIYIDSYSHINIKCKIHGSFSLIAENHLQGHGCPKCGTIHKYSLDDFIEKANRVHNFLYDYSETIYVKASLKIKIRCKIHGIFEQKASTHLIGSGCTKCNKQKPRYTLEQFINKANIVHNNKYYYSNSIYNGSMEPIEIICDKHKSFFQVAADHLNGSGCPKCVNGISKKEIEWLNYLNIPEKNRNILLKIDGYKFFPDGIDYNNKIIYEFYGDYWHGNPKLFNPNDINQSSNKTFGYLYELTMKKEKLLKNAGYMIISIWESDYNKLIKQGII